MKLNFINKMLLFFSINLVNTGIQAQTNLNIIPEESGKGSSLPINTIPVNSNSGNINSINTIMTAEAVPTPEQQGFDKFDINGKTVYMKKTGDVIIEYRPK